MVPSTLLAEEFDQLVKLLTVHYAYPLPYPLAGAYFEEIFAAAVRGKREPRKLLFDVVRENIGWSLKTHQSEKQTGSTFEVVIKRSDILKNKNLSLDDPVQILGNQVAENFHAFVTSSTNRQDINDSRVAFLIRNKNQNKFIFFQQQFPIYSPDKIVWRWANDDNRSIMGFVNNQLMLRWYRSGTQLFGVYNIPLDAHEFRIDWQRADLDETIAFFTSQRIVRIEKKS